MYNENTKKGGGGKQQPYIPAGNGDKSGEYTNKNYSNNKVYCTKEWLQNVLTIEEISFINAYTNPEIGIKLNKAIKNNNLSKYGVLMRDNIINAINKVALNKDVILFRGINVDYSVYLNKFYYPYINSTPIYDYEICSTTTNFNRAKVGAIRDKIASLGIIFQIEVPKGYNALPISSISRDPLEEEVLLNKPKYKINRIEDISYKNFKYKKIYVKIME